ncbi:MAG: hypothetical protein IJ324_06915 [Lachnospiraceae bacterium]|nr:hypothetical protein [Lachnospiraceae bacterium]
MSSVMECRSYIAIIGDMRDSREIGHRREVQNKLNSVLGTINEKYNSMIASKFMITLGDEFQGLLLEGVRVVDIIEEIQMSMYPQQIRFGIGIGRITTDINPNMAIGADGPGYYNARTAIEYVKRSEQRSKTQSSDIRIEIEQDSKSLSVTLNTIFMLMTVIQRDWSPRQREIIWEFERRECSQAACAERLNISQSTVQRSLTSSNYYAYKEAKESVSKVLREIGN